MTRITVSRTDGPAASFDPAKTLRVTRGIISPIMRMPKTEITIDDPEPIIHTNETMEDVLAKVGTSAPMVYLTAPDNSRIAVNAIKVTDVRKPDPFDREGILGPLPADRIVAYAEFFVGNYRNLVKETVAEVEARVSRALGQVS
jgi:hypothetical protein